MAMWPDLRPLPKTPKPLIKKPTLHMLLLFENYAMNSMTEIEENLYLLLCFQCLYIVYIFHIFIT